jgi:Tol biopolymer transport system component
MEGDMGTLNTPWVPGRIATLALASLLVTTACNPDSPDLASPIDPSASAEASRQGCAWHVGDCTTAANGRIAFSRFVDDKNAWSLYSARSDGSDVQQLTIPENGVFDDVAAEWSPDGSEVTFERDYLSGISQQLFRVNADGSSLTQLFDCAGRCLGVSDPVYSPDGRWIAFDEANGDDNAVSVGIWVMNREGGGQRQITQRRAPYTSEDHVPSWSPDGRRIAFTRSYYQAVPAPKQAVFVCNLDGSNLHRITPWQLNASAPDWSPDGKAILFTSHYDIEPSGQEQLYTIRPDGSGMTKVAPRGLAQGSNLLGRFSPDGRKIVFQHLNDPYPSMPLYTMNLDGSRVTLVSSPGFSYEYPAWGTHP